MKDRIRGHLNNGKFKRQPPLFSNALKKYGVGGFKWISIEYNIDELDEMEVFWIKQLKTLFPNGYNLEIGGKAGKQLTSAHKNKISESEMGKYVSMESRIKMSKSRTGDKNHNFGKAKSTEWKNKRSASTKGDNNPIHKKKDPKYIEKIASVKNLINNTTLSNKDISLKVGVTYECVRLIRNGKIWKDNK